MRNFKELISPALDVFPRFQNDGGQNMELSHFIVTEDGVSPVYVETDEVSSEEALSILLGGDGE